MTEPTKTVLLSSVCKPFGAAYGDGFGVSAEGTHQIMWAQGAFRTRATTTQWGIDFIAANLAAPTTTLHYPTMAQFIAEVKKGYDYVGIAFVSATLHKLKPMLRAVRTYAPKSRIVLGGYGTALGAELEPLADHICRGEGVAFMRALLGEPVAAPIVQPDITQRSTFLSIPLPGETGYIFAGLGCPNGCDFCATSHQYDRKHIRFLPDGRAILGAIHDLRARHPGMDQFWITDEDFLLDPVRGRSFLEAVRQSDLPPLSLSVFSSVRALSQYAPSELVEMGIDWVWVGYEGARAGYSKMEGQSYRELFGELQRHGISVLASMIIGFDYQTPAVIAAEYEELLSLRPSMSQFLIYGPPPATPFRRRMEAEGRLDPVAVADRTLHDGFTLVFRHPHMSAAELSAIQRRLYREEFSRLGPSVFRIVENLLAGYLTLRDHPAPRVRAKAERYARDVKAALPLVAGSRGHVGQTSAAWLKTLQARIEHALGPMNAKQRLTALAVPALIRLTEFKLRHDIAQQPTFTRRTFRLRPGLKPFGAFAPRPA